MGVIGQLLAVAGLLVVMGVLYFVVRWAAGHWNRFWGAQADKIEVAAQDRVGATGEGPRPSAATPDEPPPAP